MREPTNKDIVDAFTEHSKEDHKFQEETRETDLHIQDTLKLILVRLDSIEEKLEPIVKIYNGIVFSRQALVWTAGIAVAIGAIAGAVKVFGL